MEDTRFYDHMTKMDIKVLRAHCWQVEFFTSNTDLHPYAQKDRQRNRQTDRVLPFYEQRNYFSVYIISVSQINPRLLHLDVYFYDRPSNVTYYMFFVNIHWLVNIEDTELFPRYRKIQNGQSPCYIGVVSVLTHYQTTNFRLFQTEGVCRRQFQI